MIIMIMIMTMNILTPNLPTRPYANLPIIGIFST